VRGGGNREGVGGREGGLVRHWHITGTRMTVQRVIMSLSAYAFGVSLWLTLPRCRLFGRSGPFWARHYLFYHNGRPLTLIYEVFSPNLDEWLGDSALPEDLYLP